MRVPSGNGFDGYNAFMAGLMRQPGRRGHIADRPDAGHIGAAHGIGVDMALGGCDAQRFETNILGIGDNADGDDTM